MLTTIAEKMAAFDKRFDIRDEASHAQEFEKFRQRILTSFSSIDQIADSYSFQLLEAIPHGNSCPIYSMLCATTDEKLFYRLIQTIFHLEFPYPGSKLRLYKQVEEIVNISKINLSIIQINNEIVLFPRGEKLLDEKLVNHPLRFLNDKASIHFQEALELYEVNEPRNAILSATKLRRTLEEFLCFKLQNQKNLENNIPELTERLKSDGRDSRTRNIIFQVFNYMEKYFNNNEKHSDGNIDSIENEFLVYQVGLLTRYIDRIIN